MRVVMNTTDPALRAAQERALSTPEAQAAVAREAQYIANAQDKVILKNLLPPQQVLHGSLLGEMAAQLALRGGSLNFNGQPVRPEQRITHRTARLRTGIGAPSTGDPAKPDPVKRALRQQREQLGMSPRQQRKALKAIRRAAAAQQQPDA